VLSALLTRALAALAVALQSGRLRVRSRHRADTTKVTLLTRSGASRPPITALQKIYLPWMLGV